MASPKLTEDQAKKQKEKLAEYHEKRKAGEIEEKRPIRKLSSSFREMQNAALDIISKAIKGDSTATKSQIDAAWKVVSSIMASERSEQDKEIREQIKKIRQLEQALKTKQAEEAGAIVPRQEIVKQQHQEKGLEVIKGGHFQYNPEWDEEDISEEDLDDDNN